MYNTWYKIRNEYFKQSEILLFFRSSGDTLSRENFYKLKQRLAETRMLAAGLARPEDTYASPDEHGFGVSFIL